MQINTSLASLENISADVNTEASEIMLLLVVLLASLGYSIAQAGPSCDAVFAANNINKTDLMLGAGHGIHSITVRDIRYYFDPDFPEDNDIPTVNPDFR